MEQCKSDGGTVWWNSVVEQSWCNSVVEEGTVMVQQCGGAVEHS